MPIRYRLDPATGRFTVRAFATGLLAAMGHSPTFAVVDYSGFVRFDSGEIKNLALELTIAAASLSLIDRVSDSDRAEIEGRMRRDVLDIAAFPEIRYRASCASVEPIAPGRYRMRIVGPLSLHGVDSPHPIDLELLLLDAGVRLQGATPVRLSEHRIRPVTALAGAIKLKDELQVDFDVFAREEEGP